MTALVWIQREFRIDYLPALQQALEHHNQIIVAYFHSPQLADEGGGKTSPTASDVWLAKALHTLQSDYQKRQGRLWIVTGDFSTQFEELVKQYAIAEVFYSYQVGQRFFDQQTRALEICTQHQIQLTPCDSEDLIHPTEITNLSGLPYKVFTPYCKKVIARLHQMVPLKPSPSYLQKTDYHEVPEPFSNVPDDLQIACQAHWATNVLHDWEVGEKAAWQRFHDFTQDDLQGYSTGRDFPAMSTISRLSPYLHFGHINVRSLYVELLANQQEGAEAQAWIRQLVWRSFARYLMVWFANKERQPFNDRYRHIEWSQNQTLLKDWQTGHTGIPIVDAGMRELWHTGTMHNRVRMLVASLLTKNLNLHWINGLEWFENTLFDADPANNSMGWQWVAGCGVDAAPYYRLFNPVVQSQKFDKQGEYIKRWLPELQTLSEKAVHEPWNHPLECEMKGVTLGQDYPHPIVDLAKSRVVHLQRVERLKSLNSDELN